MWDLIFKAQFEVEAEIFQFCLTSEIYQPLYSVCPSRSIKPFIPGIISCNKLQILAPDIGGRFLWLSFQVGMQTLVHYAIY